MRCGICQKNDSSVDIEHVRSCTGLTAESATPAPPAGSEPQWPASEKQINYVLVLQKGRNLPDWWPTRTEADLRSMEKDDVSNDIAQLLTFTHNQGSVDVGYVPAMPAGRYALKGPGIYAGDPEVWRFYEVQDGKGRWVGYKFLKRLIGAPGDYQKNPVPVGERQKLFKAIDADPKKAMVDYGLQSGVCGRCSSPLSDPTSLKRGLGPECAKKEW